MGALFDESVKTSCIISYCTSFSTGFSFEKVNKQSHKVSSSNLTGVSVEVPPDKSDESTITLRGEPDKLGLALTQVYEKANSVVTVEVEAPKWLHRFIIGRKGENIKKITEGSTKVNLLKIECLDRTTYCICTVYCYH